MTRTLAYACAAVAMAAVLSPIDAHGMLNKPQVSVFFGDLNLNHPAGVTVLLRRLTQVSQKVCGGAPDIRDIQTTAAFNVCVQDAMDHAVAAVHVPMVAQAYGKPELVAEGQAGGGSDTQSISLAVTMK